MKVILKRNKSKFKHCCPCCDLYQTYEYTDEGRTICDNCKHYEYYTIMNEQDIKPTFVVHGEK